MSSLVPTSNEYDDTPDPVGFAQDIGARMVEDRLSPAEKQAADLSGNAKEWRAKQFLAARYSVLYGDSMDQVSKNLPSYIQSYHGEALDPETSMKRVLMTEGQEPAANFAAAPPATDAQEKPGTSPLLKAAGVAVDVMGQPFALTIIKAAAYGLDKPLADAVAIPQADKDEAAKNDSALNWVSGSRNGTFINDAARSVVGGAYLASMNTIATTLRIGGWKASAMEMDGYLSAFALANGPTEEQGKRMADASGLYKQLLNPETYSYNIAGAIGSSLPFMVGGMGTVAAMRNTALSPMMRRVLPGIVGAIPETLSNAGADAQRFTDKRREFENTLEFIKDRPEAEQKSILLNTVRMSLEDTKDVVRDLHDPEYVNRYSMASLHRNLVINMALGALEFGLGSKAVESWTAKGKARAVAYGLVSHYLNNEQELKQDKVSNAVVEAAIKASAVHLAMIDVLPLTTIRGVFGYDPQAFDTSVACLGLLGRSSLVTAWGKLAEVKTLEAKMKFWAGYMPELEKRAAGGDPHYQALFAAMATDKTGFAAVDHYTRVLHEKAVAAANYTQRRVEQAATPAEAAQVNPDDALTTGVMNERRAELDEVRRLADAADLAAEADAVGADGAPVADTATPGVDAAPVVDPLAGHVAFVQGMIDNLNQAVPNGPRLELVRRADLPPEAVAAAGDGNEVHSWYDPGTNKIYLVAEALTGNPKASLAVVEAMVLGKWAHETSHYGARLLLGHTEAERDAFLVGLGQLIAPEKTAPMLGRTGLTPAEIAANPQHAMAVSVEEYLVRIAEAKVSGQGAALDAKQAKVWQRVKDWIKQGARNLARSAGMRLELTDAEAERWAMRLFARGVEGEAPAAAAAPAARRGFNPKNILEQNADIMPVCAEVARRGGIRTTAGAGETDGRPDMQALAPFGPVLFTKRETAQAPDQMLHDLAGEERSMFGANDPVSTLWERMAGEVEGYRKARANDKQQAADDKQATAFARDAMEPGTRLYSIPVSDLNGGDVVTVGGEAMTVTDINADTGAVTLQGGDKYGAQELGNDAVIYADAKPAPAAPGAAGDGVRFKIEPKGDGQLQTPQFKKFFGDWELAALFNNLRYARGSDQARAAAKEFIGIPLTNQDSGIIATVSGETFGKMLSRSAVDLSVSPQAHMQALANLDKLFELAAHRTSRSDRKGNPAISAMHHFDVPMRFDGDVLMVKIMAKEFSKIEQGTRLYLVQAVEIEKPASNRGEPTSPEATPVSVPPAGFNDKIAAMVAAVKPGGVSAVVDANGKPLVVYHGSPDVRGIFRDGFKKGSRGSVFFAAADYVVADSYADDHRAFDYQNAEPQTIPLYLSIKNPLVIDAGGKHWRQTGEHIERARAGGHDGVIIKNTVDFYNNKASSKTTTVYAWFDSSQAKSAVVEQLRSRVDGKPIENATANNGEFDGKNRGIRYKIEPVAAPTLGAKEKMLSAVVTRGIFKGKPAGERFIARELAEMGLDPKQAPAVLLYGKLKAEQWRQELGALRNDDQILPALVDNHLKERYAANIESAHGVGEAQGRMMAKMFAGLAEAKKRDAVQFAESRRGLSDAELEAAGAVNLRKRLDNVVADFAPEAKAKRKAALPDEAPADLMPQGQADEQQAAPPPLDELAAESAADLDAEAAALAPIPAKLPTDPVDVAALKTLVVAVATKKLEAAGHKITNPNWDYALRKEVAATYARLLREAAFEHIPAGAARERAMLAAQDMAAHPPTMETLHKHFSRQVYFVSRAAARADTNAIGRKIKWLLNLKAVKEKTGNTTELIQRPIPPEVKAGLLLVKDVYDASPEMAARMIDSTKKLIDDVEGGMVDEADIRATLAARFPSMGRESYWKTVDIRDALDDVLSTLAEFGAATSRTPAEVAGLLVRLQAKYEGGITDILNMRIARAALLEPKRSRFNNLVSLLPPQNKGKEGHKLTFTFHALKSLLSSGRGTEYTAGVEDLRQIELAVQAAHDGKLAYVMRNKQECDAAFKRIYGNIEAVIREMRTPQERYRKYSECRVYAKEGMRPGPLSKFNLMQMVAELEQRQYSDRATAQYLDAIRSELSAKDLRLLDYFRDWARRSGQELSPKSMEMLGVPVVSPDPLYWHAVLNHDSSGLAEMRITLQIAFPALTQRVNNKNDLDETADILNVFFKQVESNAHFLNFSNLTQDTRFFFGNKDTRRTLKSVLGPQRAAAILQDITEVVGDRALGANDKDGFLARLRASTSLFVMGYNLGSMVRQLAGLPVFQSGMTGWTEFGHSIGRSLKDGVFWSEGFEILLAHPAYREYFRMGGWSESSAQAMRETYANPALRGIAKVMKMGMMVPGAGAWAATMPVLPGYMLNRRDLHERTMSREKAQEIALNETMLLLEATQGSSQLSKQNMRRKHGGELYRMGMQFQGPVEGQLSFQLSALADAVAKAPGSKKRLLDQFIVNHILVPGFYMLADIAYRYMRGDFKEDPDKELEAALRRWIAMACLGPASAWIVVGTVAEGLINLFAGVPSFGGGAMPTVSTIGRTGRAVYELLTHMFYSDMEELSGLALNVIASASSPVREGKRAAKNYSE